MFVKPWSKEAENCFRRLVKDRVVYTDDISFTRKLGRAYPELFDKTKGVMDIGRIEKRKESIIAIRPGNTLIPLGELDCRKRKFTSFKFFKI